jgi:hypothetical protein
MLRESLLSVGIVDIEVDKQFIKTEFSSIELKQDKDTAILKIEIRDINVALAEEIIKSLSTFLK